MARLPTLLMFALFVAPVLAGCITGQDADEPDDPASGTARAALLAHLASIPEPEFDRVAAVDWWEDFVTTYTKRDNSFPNNALAAEHIRSDLVAAGYDTQIIEYEWDRGTGLPGDAVTVRVVEGIKPGTANPDEWVGLISHYDTQTATIEGAYDDGSGVAVEMSLCNLLAEVETNKTIACLFFDAEELGLVGSQLYVQDKIAEGDEDFVYDQAFGYDMVGLNWPGYDAWKMYVMAGLDTPELGGHMLEHLAFLNVTLFEFLGAKLNVTSEGVEVLDVHDRNSDERRFKEEGVPIGRFAGGRNASDYPEYHRPGDTAEYVYEYAGGRENFEKGYEMIVLSSYYTILAYDQYDPLALPDLS